MTSPNPYQHIDHTGILVRVDRDGRDWATVLGPDGRFIDRGHVADVYERIVEHYFAVDRSQPVEQIGRLTVTHDPYGISATTATRCRWTYDTGAAVPLRCDKAAGHAGRWHECDGMSWLDTNTSAEQVGEP